MLSACSSIPEVQLAAAVIQRALEDAMTPDDRLARPRAISTKAGKHQTFTAGLKPRDRDEAVRFLIDPAPGWAESREAWCDHAGVDPSIIRRYALRHIPASAFPRDLLRLRPMAVITGGQTAAPPAPSVPNTEAA